MIGGGGLGLTGDTGIGFPIQLLHCSYLIKNTSLLNGIMWVFDWFIFFLLSGFKYQLPKFNKKFGVHAVMNLWSNSKFTTIKARTIDFHKLVVILINFLKYTVMNNWFELKLPSTEVKLLENLADIYPTHKIPAGLQY